MVRRPDPFARFSEVLARAGAQAPSARGGHEADPFEHLAFSLATVDATGYPTARMMLLRGFDERGFVFYSNFESRKGRAMAEVPRAAMCFFWPWMKVQVRVEGRVERVSDDEADQYFATRPHGSRIGAWASKQSEPMGSKAELVAEVATVEARFAGRTVPRPPFWGGYRLMPDRIEFWHDGLFRLHDRDVYVRDGDAWTVSKLYP